jgi:hypothetical protein
MRKIMVAGVAIAIGATAFAGAAAAGGNGAQRSGLSPTAGSATSQCEPGSGAGTNGFVITNAPGPPLAAIKVNGEVSLKRGTPDSVYSVWLATDSSNCMMENVLTTNEVGNGNAHINDPTKTSGTYYVVLQDSSGNEVFASGPVTVN